MDETIERQIVTAKIVEAFKLMGELLGHAVAAKMLEIHPSSSAQSERWPLLLTMKEASDYLGMGKTALHELAQAGTIPRVYVGGRPKYRTTDLDQFVQMQITGAAEINRKPRRQKKS